MAFVKASCWSATNRDARRRIINEGVCGSEHHVTFGGFGVFNNSRGSRTATSPALGEQAKATASGQSWWPPQVSVGGFVHTTRLPVGRVSVRRRPRNEAPALATLLSNSSDERPASGRRMRRRLASHAVSRTVPERNRTSVYEDPSMPLVRVCLEAADERKAQELTAIRVSHLTYVTSFFVFATGLSRTQISAIARRIEERVAEVLSRKPLSASFRGVNASPPGQSGWVTIDYGEVIVNIMSPEARSYYDMDTLWGRGEAVDVDRVLGAQQLDARTSPGTSKPLPTGATREGENDASVFPDDSEWDLEPGAEASLFSADFHSEERTDAEEDGEIIPISVELDTSSDEVDV
jgi:ribosome-associated protein